MRMGTANGRCVSETRCLLEVMHLTHQPMCWDVPSPNPALQSWPSFKFGLMGRAPHLTLPFSSPQNLPEMNSVLTLTQAKSLCLERPFYICSTEEEHMLILAMADPLGPHLWHTQYKETLNKHLPLRVGGMLSFITLPHPRCSPGFLQALLEQPGSFPVCGKWPPCCGLCHLPVSCSVMLSAARKQLGTKAPSCTGWRESVSAPHVSNDGFNTLMHLKPNQKPDLEMPVPLQRSWC